MNNINVCLSYDDKYSKYAGVVIASILTNAKTTDSLSIYILDGGISDIRKQQILSLKSIKDCDIKFVAINPEDFEDYKKVCTHKYITLATYYRLKLASLLPDLSKIIYFDCDMVVNDSLKELFDTNLENYLIAGVQDIDKRMLKENPHYVNAGMLIFNLDLIRKENIEEKFLKYTQENFETIKCGDQTIINEVCKDKIKLLNPTWNVQSSNFTNRSSYINNPKIIHYVAKNKPWNGKSFSYHKNLYFKYLQLTPWKLSEEELKQNLKSTAIDYFRYRPLFLFRPRFYKALFETYVKPVFSYKKPIIKNNTFIVLEICSKSHSEVVPGYVKYLLDLGYHVSVCVNSNRYKEGLFARFKSDNVSLNNLSRRQIKEFFKKDNLENVAGVLVTTVGKLCDEIHFDECYKFFNENVDKSKLFFVEHEAKHAVDAGTWRENLITLRELNYKGAKSVVVNPHYFGEVKFTPKNTDITNFITVGAIQGKRKNNDLIINSVRTLHEKGYRNFKVTVIGKGCLKHLPKEIRSYFDIKGHLPFDEMYDELEKSDFMLTPYDVTKPMHQRYNTTGTSGNFQLVYGFLKPCLIVREFAPINGFNDENSILYDDDCQYANAMEKCINMQTSDYVKMQENLKIYQQSLYKSSLQNLKELIKNCCK